MLFAAKGVLESTIAHDGYDGADSLSLEGVTVNGLRDPVTMVSVDGQDWLDFEYDQDTKVWGSLWSKLIILVAMAYMTYNV